MSPPHSHSGKKDALFAAVAAVAATYAYFLLFAQFGFLRALPLAAGGEQGVIKQVLGLMGGAGILGSVAAARGASSQRGPGWLIAGFIICAAAAGFVAVGVSKNYFYSVAVLIGLGTGMTTVTLAGLLAAAAGAGQLGLVIGLGTGAAYAFCNLPGIFDAAPATQAGISLAIAALGALAASRMQYLPDQGERRAFDYSPAGIALWTMVFFALVSLDSGAFYMIQNTPSLKSATWTGEGRLGIIAIVHFVAAVFGGLAFDRRWIGRTTLFAAILLAAACGIIGFFPRFIERGALLYVIAVSVYSVALVFYSAQSGRASIAAIVYAIAGWFGSAVGIGLAEHHQTLSPAVITATATVALLAMLLRWFFLGRSSSPIR